MWRGDNKLEEKRKEIAIALYVRRVRQISILEKLQFFLVSFFFTLTISSSMHAQRTFNIRR